MRGPTIAPALTISDCAKTVCVAAEGSCVVVTP
jgi:hypothetical protein